jgi:hypothetical protein
MIVLPIHSLLIQDISAPAELDEIKVFDEKRLPIMRDYVNSFNKNIIQELRS